MKRNPKRRNRGKSTEILKVMERQNSETVESRNGGKSPQIPKDGITERRKIPSNLKRRNDGKSTEMFKGGIAENQPKS